ncbi:hypothetical protein PISMIDRAFT_670976 [Pisolithus microcarpus 441]|uniref:Unplaced genomic scaffold scaffold_2, whole genome shotgun sequence n=1 Tax=Pisolithus microcarpus 441 TaxID=765257 RepID=A0A0C9Z036_9AGAM|nr:hypothetical protein PISMIDRAFT_670976 [Pisolithus microcarpus 441]
MGVSVCEAPNLVLMSFVCSGLCSGGSREVPAPTAHADEPDSMLSSYLDVNSRDET